MESWYNTWTPYQNLYPRLLQSLRKNQPSFPGKTFFPPPFALRKSPLMGMPYFLSSSSSPSPQFGLFSSEGSFIKKLRIAQKKPNYPKIIYFKYLLLTSRYSQTYRTITIFEKNIVECLHYFLHILSLKTGRKWRWMRRTKRKRNMKKESFFLPSLCGLSEWRSFVREVIGKGETQPAFLRK